MHYSTCFRNFKGYLRISNKMNLESSFLYPTPINVRTIYLGNSPYTTKSLFFGIRMIPTFLTIAEKKKTTQMRSSGIKKSDTVFSDYVYWLKVILQKKKKLYLNCIKYFQVYLISWI